jgi:hypothetical protein
VSPSRASAGGALLALLYAGAASLPFRAYGPRFSSHVIGDHGDALLQHLHCAWQWLALAEGRFSELLTLPTMHPYHTGLAFGEPLVGAVLLFAPAYALTGSSAAAFNAAVVGSFLLLGLATFLWVRGLFASPAAGLLSAVLVIFTPWRLHYLSALNVLTLHYAVFGLWCLTRWLRRPRLRYLIAAAALFHVQLVTAAQAAVAGIYLASIWLAVEWARSGLRLERRRLLQGVVAGAVFLGLSLPWLAFFDVAFAATPGLLSTRQMTRYSEPFAGMLRLLGVCGPLGVLAAAGVPALLWAARRNRLPPGVGWSVLGIGCGAAALFVVALGPYVGPATDPTALPGYFAARFLPLVDVFRAPIRLATLTPVILAALAGGGYAVFERSTLRRLPGPWAAAGWLVPLGFALSWPTLDPAMASPIAERPGDRALAEALADLPPSSAILSLPLELGPNGAGVDERVLFHRRAQIGGFASVVPLAFRQAALRLGQWPYDGHDIARALGATHLVVPERWVERHRQAVDREGYEWIAAVDGRAILVPPARPAPESAFQLRVPSSAAAGRWLTLSLTQTALRFERRGHQRLAATWRAASGVVRVEAMAFFPGVVGPRAPIQIHVPTPESPGRYELAVALPGFPVEASLDVSRRPSTFDTPIRDVAIALAPDYRTPGFLRADAAFRVEVELTARAGPILLASSRRTLPERRGETVVAFQYRAPEGRPLTGRLLRGAALAGDLAPGERLRQVWDLPTPSHPGRYDLYVRLVAQGLAAPPMRWIRLMRDLEIESD